MSTRRAKARKHTIQQSLTDLGLVDATSLASATTRDEEFKVIKKRYHKACLQHHPDKGGDADMFREIHTSYELLRDLHEGKVPPPRRGIGSWLFSDYLVEAAAGAKAATDEAFDMSAYDTSFSQQAPPSWEFYAHAAADKPPTYRVELAKSGRSRCKATGKFKACNANPTPADEPSTDLVDLTVKPEMIRQGEVRVGWMNEDSGTYGGWKHLRCWRVPNKVRTGRI